VVSTDVVQGVPWPYLIVLQEKRAPIILSIEVAYYHHVSLLKAAVFREHSQFEPLEGIDQLPSDLGTLKLGELGQCLGVPVHIGECPM